MKACTGKIPRVWVIPNVSPGVTNVKQVVCAPVAWPSFYFSFVMEQPIPPLPQKIPLLSNWLH